MTTIAARRAAFTAAYMKAVQEAHPSLPRDEREADLCKKVLPENRLKALTRYRAMVNERAASR